MKLWDKVVEWHGEQKRKYTGEPYYQHLLNVHSIASQYERYPLLFECCICHDLIEDTPVTLPELKICLEQLGYDKDKVDVITKVTQDLTDVYTKEAFPELNRKQRKKLESGRLLSIQPLSQTIKYADIIDNLRSIVDYDPGFAKVYLDEAKDLLHGMRGGNSLLFLQACHEVYTAIKHT